MTNETLEEETARLRSEVEVWLGMYRIAATGAEAAGTSEAKLIKDLWKLYDLVEGSGDRVDTEVRVLTEAAIQSAEARKK